MTLYFCVSSKFCAKKFSPNPPVDFAPFFSVATLCWLTQEGERWRRREREREMEKEREIEKGKEGKKENRGIKRCNT